jgi:hypothetical protein
MKSNTFPMFNTSDLQAKDYQWRFAKTLIKKYLEICSKTESRTKLDLLDEIMLEIQSK